MRKGKKWLAAALSAAMIVQSLAGIGPVYAASGVSLDTFTDATFKKYVSAFDTDGNGYLSDKEIAAVTSIDLTGVDGFVKNIDGIDIFNNLTNLDCSGKSIRSIDIQKLKKLKSVDVSENMLSDLTLPTTADDLVYLDVSDTNITSLTSLSDYDNLTYLNVSNTNLDSINVQSMKNLQTLGVSRLTIRTLDLGENMNLQTLVCENMTGLATLDLSGHDKLVTVLCDSNLNVAGAITKLDVSGDTSLETLDCSNNKISTLDISNTPALENLDCSSTKLRSLDITNNTNLTSLIVDNTPLGELNLRNNRQLSSLSAVSVGLTSLDLTAQNELKSLDLTGNSLTGLDVSGNAGLETLNLGQNKLEAIDVSKNTELTTLKLDDNQLVSIDISKCPKLRGDGGVFSCVNNTKSIILEKPNYELDMASLGEFGFAGPKSIERDDSTIGDAALAYGYEGSKKIDVTGATVTGNRFQAETDATKIKYKYYCGIGKNKVDFTLNIQNPLTVVVWYTAKDGVEQSGASSMKFAVGAQTTLVAKDKAKNNHENITWDSNDTKVATIDKETGLLTCKGEGTTNIIVNLNNRAIGSVKLECHDPVSNMTFVDNKTKEIYGDGSAINMELGNYAQSSDKSKNITAKFFNAQGEVASEFAGYTCKVTDAKDGGKESSDVVTFSDGTITACGRGVAYLHFTSNDNKDTKIVVQVNVKQRANSMKLPYSTLTMIEGDKKVVTPVFTPTTTSNQEVTWSSSNPSVVTFDKDGKFIAVGKGTADVTCTSNDVPDKVSAKCTVTVLGAVGGITMDKSEAVLSIPSNKYIQLNPVIDADDSTVYKQTWTSSDPNVARVSTTGYVTAQNKGETIITCKLTDALYATCRVKVVQNVTGIALSVDKNILHIGDTMQVVSEITPDDADNKTLTWTSSDTSVATVDKNGLITAVGKGNTTIKAETTDGSNRSKTISIQVKKYVSDVKLDMTQAVVYVDRTKRITVKVVPSDANDKNIIWESSDNTIATVSGSSTQCSITGVTPGKVTITGKTSDGSNIVKKIYVTVSQQITGITFDPEEKTVNVGDVYKTKYTLEPANADSKALIWTSSNEAVAKVSSDGTVTAVSKGFANITATPADGIGTRAFYRVTVLQPLKSLVLSESSLRLSAGKVTRVTATVAPDNANNRNLEWTSSNVKVATVEGGNITAVGKGTATITCKTTDGSNLVRKCTVTVFQPITELTFGRAEYTLNVGKTVKPAYKIAPSNADSVKLNWTSTNTSVAKVAADGTVTAVSKGNVTITATPADGVGARASYRVNVLQPVTKITLGKTRVKLNVGSSTSVNVTIAPSNASERNVTWTTSNRKVATVNNGYVTAVGKGTATITCKAKDGSGKIAKCTITVVQPVKTLKLNAKSKTLVKGKKTVLKAIVGPASASNRKVKWTTSNKKVATVTATGVVKVVGKGTAVITCTTKDGTNLRATCTITGVVKVSSIKLNKTKAVVKRGKTLGLTAKVAPSAANDKSVVWVSSNKKIATVSATGVVTARKKGKVTITCKAKDGSRKAAKCVIIVK